MSQGERQDYFRWHPEGGDWSPEDSYLAYRGSQFCDAYYERQALRAELDERFERLEVAFERMGNFLRRGHR